MGLYVFQDRLHKPLGHPSIASDYTLLCFQSLILLNKLFSLYGFVNCSYLNLYSLDVPKAFFLAFAILKSIWKKVFKKVLTNGQNDGISKSVNNISYYGLKS